MLFKKGKVKILLLQKKWWSAAACLCLAAAIFYVVNYPAAVGASASTRQLPIYCVQRDQKMVSISFDAAWGDVILRQAQSCRDQEAQHTMGLGAHPADAAAPSPASSA